MKLLIKEIITEIGQDKLKYCFVYVPEGKKMFDSDEAVIYSNSDNDFEADIYEETIIITYASSFNKHTCIFSKCNDTGGVCYQRY